MSHVSYIYTYIYATAPLATFLLKRISYEHFSSPLALPAGAAAPQVTSLLQMSHLYYRCHIFTKDVTSLLQMSHLYYRCHIFTTDVICLLQMSHLYYRCHIFTTDVTYLLQMSHLYYRCHIFTAPLVTSLPH